MIQLKNVNKIYGKGKSSFAALKNVTINVANGEKVAIVGKSGSGKSTLMHVMSGLDSVSSGAITINSQQLTSMKSKEIDRFRSQDIGFIFQSFFIEPNQTCLQNVMLPLEITKIPRPKRKKLAQNALQQVGLSDKESELAVNLSGGQKQRLAIARAIVNKPKIIFADEPTGNLDSTTGDMIVKLLFDLNKTIHATILIVTHDKELAHKCDRLIEIKDGKIVRSNHTQPTKPKKPRARIIA